MLTKIIQGSFIYTALKNPRYNFPGTQVTKITSKKVNGGFLMEQGKQIRLTPGETSQGAVLHYGGYGCKGYCYSGNHHYK